MIVEPPEGLKHAHNLVGSKDLELLFHVFETLNSLDRLHFFIHSKLVPTNSIGDTVPSWEIWMRYRAWAHRNHDPLPEQQMIDQMQEWGYPYNEETGSFEFVKYREFYERCGATQALKKAERTLQEMRQKYRGQVERQQWTGAAATWTKMQQFMEDAGLTRR